MKKIIPQKPSNCENFKIEFLKATQEFDCPFFDFGHL